MDMKHGHELHPSDQAHVLARYVHRFTREHKPAWARELRFNGHPYPVQFASDQEWLENTRFAVRKDGRLDRRARFCQSVPTWPDGRPSDLGHDKILDVT
jgi:hypothetical protein